MRHSLLSTLLFPGFLLAGTASAQTTIDLTTGNGVCSYATSSAVTVNTTNGHMQAVQNGTPSGPGCTSGGSSVPAVTFGPAANLSATATSLAGGTSVGTSFAFQPLYATSCTGSIQTAGPGTGSFTGGSTLCNSAVACSSATPLRIPATFTNTSTTTPTTYNVSVTCTAAAGAIPASTTSNTVTITQAKVNSGGTPSANFTFVTSGLTATFTDTSTDTGGTIGSYSWNFGDGSGLSTAINPSHTYASANTYSVTETVTDSVGGTQSSKTQSVTVSSGGSCATIASSTPTIATNFTQLTGTTSAFYFGGGSRNVDPTSFASVYWLPWPGTTGIIPTISIPFNKYVSEAFTVPANYMTASNAPNPLYGDYMIGESLYSARVSMTISTTCGDFSNPTATGSTVVSGCYFNNQIADYFLQWRNSGSCVLSNSTSYYLNFINANIANVLPGGGTAASSKNGNCGTTTCTTPIQNGPNTWGNPPYTPN